MKVTEILKMALESISANKLRSVLTLLIIAFGLMALVGILTALDSLLYSLNDSFSDLGSNSFTIQRKNVNLGGGGPGSKGLGDDRGGGGRRIDWAAERMGEVDGAGVGGGGEAPGECRGVPARAFEFVVLGGRPGDGDQAAASAIGLH